MTKTVPKNPIVKLGAANAVSQAITILSQLVSIPFLIHAWGVQGYGMWVALSTIPAFLALADFGISATAGNRAEGLLITEGSEAAYRTLVTSFLGLSIIAAIVCAGAVLFSIYGENRWLEHCGLPTSIEARWGFAALCASSYCSLLAAFQTNQFRLISALPEAVWIGNVLRIIEAVLIPVSVLFLNAGILATCLITFALRLAQLIYAKLRLSKLGQPSLLSFRLFSPAEAIAVIAPAFWRLAFPLGQALQQQVVTLLVAKHLSANDLVQFSIYRSLSRATLQFSTFLQQSTWVEYTNLYARNEIRKIHLLHSFSIQLSVVLGASYLLVLSVLGGWFVHFWSAGAVAPSYSLGIWFGLAAIPEMVWSASSTQLIAVNRNFAIGIPFLVSRVAIISIVPLGIGRAGLITIPVSLFLIDVFFMYWVVAQTCKVSLQPPLALGRSLLSPKLWRESVEAFELFPRSHRRSK